MLPSKLYVFSLLLTVSICKFSYAASCEQRSGLARAALIELYTSEGCSSCPPADRWMRQLIPKVFSASEVVPLAFHVDYWDRLGWRDRFASPVFTARQYASAKASGSGFVFTPQVILGGRNYPGWSNISSLQQDVRLAHSLAPEADIVLHQQSVASGKVEFEVKSQLRGDVKLSDVRIYAALFQNGLESEVLHGENEGSRLQHDFVVRELYTSKRIDSSGRISIHEHFGLPADAKAGEMGVAVFAQDAKTGTVLQAMSAPLCLTRK